MVIRVHCSLPQSCNNILAVLTKTNKQKNKTRKEASFSTLTSAYGNPVVFSLHVLVMICSRILQSLEYHICSNLRVPTITTSANLPFLLFHEGTFRVSWCTKQDCYWQPCEHFFPLSMAHPILRTSSRSLWKDSSLPVTLFSNYNRESKLWPDKSIRKS